MGEPRHLLLNLPWPGLRLALAVAFAGFAAWAYLFSWQRRMRVALAVLFLGVAAWWIAIQPSHDRAWRPEVAVMPRAYIDGDRVRLTGVRNFDYRSRDDFTVRYEEREVWLSRMSGLDFYISYWAEGPVGHTYLSFLFDDAPPLTISIETRPEVGEGFAPVASLFKQFELIYVVGDKRDLVGLRANHRQEAVFLYRLNTPAEDRPPVIPRLPRADQRTRRSAEFYHLLSNSCTVNIMRYANAAGREGALQHQAPAERPDRPVHLCRRSVVDTSLPFEELRRRSRITASAQAAAGAEGLLRCGSAHPCRRLLADASTAFHVEQLRRDMALTCASNPSMPLCAMRADPCAALAVRPQHFPRWTE